MRSCTGPTTFFTTGHLFLLPGPDAPLNFLLSATAAKPHPHYCLKSAGDLKIATRTVAQAENTDSNSCPWSRCEYGTRAGTPVQETRIPDSAPKTAGLGRPVVPMHITPFSQWIVPTQGCNGPLHGLPPSRPSRGSGSIHSVPSAPQDVQGSFRAAAGSPLALPFCHRRRLRLFDRSLAFFEAGAPVGPDNPADSINSPRCRRWAQFQQLGPAPLANRYYTPPPAPISSNPELVFLWVPPPTAGIESLAPPRRSH